jgi:acyl carrier protein
MDKDKFLSGLKVQFEEADAVKLTIETKFKDLDTWDSLTRFSIIAFVEDDYNLILKNEDLNNFESPLVLFEYIRAYINKSN